MTSIHFPKITFGIIVLNGEPFTLYNLGTLYPWAHQIIVVEGACPTAAQFATQSGHSTDHTLDVLRRFQQTEDPQKKIILITAEDENHPNGFWTEKDEMSQAYAKRANGDFLWQVDMDEFYRGEDMRAVIELLQTQPVTEISFRTRPFWGSLNYCTDGIFLRQGARDFHRLFAWGPGYQYVSHRPPSVINPNGQNLHSIHPISAQTLAQRGIYLYHYSFLFPFQVRFKVPYYSGLDRRDGLHTRVTRREEWAKNYFTLLHPFFIDDTSVVHDPSWLCRYDGKHPEAIGQLWQDIARGAVNVERRPTDDIERLVRNPFYRLVAAGLPIVWQPIEWMRRGARKVKQLARGWFAAVEGVWTR